MHNTINFRARCVASLQEKSTTIHFSTIQSSNISQFLVCLEDTSLIVVSNIRILLGILICIHLHIFICDIFKIGGKSLQILCNFWVDPSNIVPKAGLWNFFVHFLVASSKFPCSYEKKASFEPLMLSSSLRSMLR